MKKIVILFTALFSGVIGCTDEIDLFVGDNFLSIEVPREKSDTISNFSYTFKYISQEIMEKDIEIPVSLAGRANGETRPFVVRIIDSLTTATEGIHFQLDLEKNVIPANEYSGVIPIKLLKTPEMSEISYTLGLELVSNDYFKFGDNKNVVITFSNKIEKPTWWYTQPTANIGYYTERKLALWYEYWEITDGSDPWGEPPYIRVISPTMSVPDKAYCGPSKELFKAWLNDREDAPVYDEYGDLVILTLYRLKR